MTREERIKSAAAEYPLVEHPYHVCQETWGLDNYGSAVAELEDGRNFDTPEEAEQYAAAQRGRTKIYLMRQGPGGRFGEHYATYWNGEKVR